MFCCAHIYHETNIFRAYKNEHFHVTRLVILTPQYTSNWTWNENFLPLCIHAWIWSSHHMNNYNILITREILKDSILGTRPALGIYLKNLDIIPDIIFDIYWISQIVISGGDILSVKSQVYEIQTCSIWISIWISISCPYLDIMLDG
jgi:hypothetical protein